MHRRSLYAQETRCRDNTHYGDSELDGCRIWDIGYLQAGMLQIRDFDWYRVRFHTPLNACDGPTNSAGRIVARVDEMDASLDLQHTTYRLVVTLHGSAANVYDIWDRRFTSIVPSSASGALVQMRRTSVAQIHRCSASFRQLHLIRG